MNLSISAHFQTELVMKFYSDKIYDYTPLNTLKYKTIDATNLWQFQNKDFIPLSIINKDNFIGAFLDETPVGFACIKHRGEKGDYFNVKKSDLYLQKLYVFPEFRGRRIMQDIIINCISQKITEDRKYEITLCVRENNISAIKCYERIGFRRERKVRFIRFWKDIVFPRYTI